MARSFDFQSTFDEEIWTGLFTDAEGYQQKFLDLVRSEVEKSNFPNLEIVVDEFASGGLFFSRETTKMLVMKAKKSHFKGFEVFFRAQIFGNVVVFSRMECMERGFFSAITGKTGPQLYAEIRSKCKNQAQYEEFVGINNLGSLIFWRAIEKLDPSYKERRMLMSK